MDYKAQLKHPKWQKKRLEIMQRDNFQCQCCLNKEETLNVHHRKYIKNKKIWEYDNDDLITLCDSCHNEVHKHLDSGYNGSCQVKRSIDYNIDFIDLVIIEHRLIQLATEQNSIKTAIQLLTSQVIKKYQI